MDEDFLNNATLLISTSLEENNISIYLMAVDVARVLFQKALFSESVLGSLSSLVKAIVLRTTDSNTRVRKHSVDIINQIWSQSDPRMSDKKDTISTTIASILVDSSLQEKAIIGRLGLFIKRA